MNKRTTSAFLAFAIVWTSIAPAVPAFAANVGMEGAPVVRAVPAAGASAVQIPALPASALGSMGLPGVNAGINAGIEERRMAAGASVAAPNAAAKAAASLAGEAASAASAAAIPEAAAAPVAAGIQSAAPVSAAASNVAAYAETAQPAAQSQGAVRTIVGRLAAAITNKLPWARVFDSSKQGASFTAPAGVASIRPLPAPNLPQGIDLGNAPVTPAPKKVGGVELNAMDLPGVKSGDSIFSGPRVIQADATSEADVERALREMVDADAAKYGVTSAELKTVHVRRVAGKGDQADTVYAYFHQQRKSANVDGSVQAVEVHGSQLSFVVKVIKGRPTVMSAMAKLYPSINVKTNATISDAQAKAAAEGKLPQNAGVTLNLVERKIVFHDGSWKTVNLYEIDGLPQAVGIMVAVDVSSGEVFAWDARMGMAAGPAAPAGDVAAPDATANVNAHAKAEANDHRPKDGQWILVEQALPHLNVTINGKSMTADAEGKVSSSLSGNSGTFTADLSGSWTKINDQNRKPVKISASIKAGDNTVIANETATDEGTINQLNTYIWVTRIHDWWSQRLNNDKRIDKQIPVNSNIDDECNAYYTPGRPSLNFFKSSKNCSDTGRPGVVAHEYGHFVDDMIGGITNGGMSEGWGDIGSMFLLGTPIIGEGFLLGRNPSWIRHGENTYQYNENDEVHDQGQAWMGFAWKLRKQLVASLGEAAGTAEAEALIIPTLFAKASDIPAQMAQVLLNAMDKDGNVRYEKEIRAAAKAHGINLPQNPKGFVQTLWNGIFSSFGGVSVEEAGFAKPGIQTLNLVDSPAAGKTLVVNAGRGDREAVIAKIKSAVQYRSGEHAALSVKVSESRGTLGGAKIVVEINGPADSVKYMTEQIKRLAK